MSSSTRADLELDACIRQQDAVRELGRRALGETDLDALLEDATAAIAETLSADYAAAFERREGGDDVLLRAGVGWRDGAVGSETVPTGDRSQAGSALTDGEPVVVEDLQEESRFSGPELLADHDVASGISAVVGPPGDPWGVLEAHDTEAGAFTEHDAGFLQSVANVLASAIETERAERRLESERNEVLERVTDAVYALDEEWRFTYANDRAEALLGHSEDEVRGEVVSDVFPEAADSDLRERFREAMETQEPVSFERFSEPLDIWAQVEAYPSKTGLSVSFRDVTERKRMEEELRESERRYRTFGENFPNGIVSMFDHDLQYTLAAGQAFDDMPVDADDVEGRSVRDAWGDDVADALEPAFEAVIDGEQRSVELEYDEGNWVVHVVPITDEEGEVFAGMTMAQDVTERTEKQRQLREREQQLQRYKDYTDELLDAVDDVFYVLEESGDLQRWNESVCEVTGYSDAEIASMHGLEFFGEEDEELVAAKISEVFETGSARMEANLLTRDGESIPYEFIASALEDPEERSVLTGIGRDISERREYEQKLEGSNERLEQFAYAASHDLQEPLRMVSSYLQLVERRYGDELDEDGREFIEFAVDGADRMRDMIEGLLQYSRVDTWGDPFEAVDLDAVFENVRQDLRVKIDESDAEITAADLPRVYGDGGQLNQVFQNLLSNAIEYSGDEPPRVHVSAERREARSASERSGTAVENGGSEWVISVRDEGVGIDPGEADRVFEVFQHLHDHDEHSGTGIGLALCERIVERHGGDIWVDSEPGEGATFSFTLAEAGDHDE